ncbi:MAG: aminoacyl-tRNA hydrolase [Myxococcales bacterium]|nr:aminoacyl-tRNA hydrolase [Myxococcales bacterium]
MLTPAALSWRAVHSSGPGGQNVNKVATKVELRFDLREELGLSEAVKARLRTSNPHRFDREGALVITSQATRSQSANLEDARNKLAALIRLALQAPKQRRATRRTSGSERRRLLEKKQRSETKRLRRGPSE